MWGDFNAEKGTAAGLLLLRINFLPNTIHILPFASMADECSIHDSWQTAAKSYKLAAHEGYSVQSTLSSSRC